MHTATSYIHTLIRAVGAAAVASMCASCVPQSALFIPNIKPDGSRTWSFTLPLNSITKEDRALPREERDRKLSGYMVGWKQFCDRGWEITNSREEKGALIVDGKCL